MNEPRDMHDWLERYDHRVEDLEALPPDPCPCNCPLAHGAPCQFDEAAGFCGHCEDFHV